MAIDEMIQQTQLWLNGTYRNKYGYNQIDVNGKTGWPTIFALTRALQIELGITEPSDNFGPTTRSLFKTLSINSNPTDSNTPEEATSIQNQIYILQGALWCKGYNPGGFTGYFGPNTRQAIINFQSDAGLTNLTGEADVTIMRALLSMDAFQLLDYGSYNGDSKIREIQQFLNNNYISNPYYENDLGLIPCNGIYERKTNQALIYALQIELGISVPTGYFGPATREKCPYLTYGTENIFVKILQFALYCNGKEFDPTGFTGYFGNDTQSAVFKFQEFTCLDQSGNAGLQTWSSLLISTGDETRNGIACDCSTTITDAKAKTLVNNGRKMIGRYLTGKYALTIDECKIINDNNLNLIPIFEVYGYESSWFNYFNGASDGAQAVLAAKGLGIPEDAIIYFGVDYDAVDDEVTELIIPYFKGIYDQFNDLKTNYKIGIYAPRNVCSRIREAGYSCSSFVCDMSTGFSVNLGYPLPKDWAFDQISTITLGSGSGLIEIDNNISSGRYEGVSKFNKVDTSNLINDLNKNCSLKDYGIAINALDEEITLLDAGVLKFTYTPSVQRQIYGEFITLDIKINENNLPEIEGLSLELIKEKFGLSFTTEQEALLYAYFINFTKYKARVRVVKGQDAVKFEIETFKYVTTNDTPLFFSELFSVEIRKPDLSSTLETIKLFFEENSSTILNGILVALGVIILILLSAEAISAGLLVGLIDTVLGIVNIILSFLKIKS